MILKEFIQLYKSDSFIQTVAEATKPNSHEIIRLKGMHGSLDAIVASVIYYINHQNYLFILHDKEEAAYFQNDLQNLIPEKEVFLFPSSYKRPYDFEETENANVLMRAEILNRINHKTVSGELIVTYPEALSEKVINKKSLLNNTYSIKIGDEIDIAFLSDLLFTYDFEKSDFVYEAGQFSIRGGILDVFSFANELPYRVELFGNEVESIRTFDPDSQLSVDKLKEINIIPNIQTKLLDERRDSFIGFLPKNTKIWFKDYGQTLNIIGQLFDKATEQFNQVLQNGGNVQIVLSPLDLFDNTESFTKNLEKFLLVEFGQQFYFENTKIFNFHSVSQPSFNKNFEVLAEKFEEDQNNGIMNIVSADNQSQIDKLHTIFDEINPDIRFQDLNMGLRSGFIDHLINVAVFTDHQLFERFHRYKTQKKYTKSKALTLRELQTLQPGDYVTHIDHGIGRFVGLDTIKAGGKKQEALRLVYKGDDMLYVSIHSLHKISKYSGKDGKIPQINKLGSQEWETKKKRVKRKVKDIAADLIKLYAKRKAAPGYAFSKDSYLQAELETSFIYEDTPDQTNASEDVKKDMENPHPMDRLVCGDVGFGKTEVAIRAAFKSVCDSKQVAILVPTTILALQHYHTFSDRLANFPVNIEYINRFKSSQSIRQTLQNLKEGKTDIIIGTHRLVNKDIIFNNLGLLIIDEEQKFGVSVKEKIKEIKINVDTLILTATPIPRTLHFSLMGARDLTIIATPPPNRQPVTTELHMFNESLIRDAISFELRRGGQVFFVHNRINDIEEVANIILKLVPDARIAIAHGQMKGDKLEKIMMRFIEGEYDVLVSTNIIESGLDIPNANTILINRAHMFGLSDLHQMRGRVGRSNKKAFCYLLTPSITGITSEARKRLVVLEEFSELGDGFKVAMRDLDIRGAGNLLGGEQSGFINDLGFDAYHKILDESIQELKETEFKHLFEQDLKKTVEILKEDCSIETDLEILIPENYVSNISERLNLYSKLDNIKNEEELLQFTESIRDRFGPLPDTVNDLVETVRTRWLAEKLGFEKLILKNGKMKSYFTDPENETYFNSEIFGKILQFVQRHPRISKMKDIKNKLIMTVDEINSVDKAKLILDEMLK